MRAFAALGLMMLCACAHAQTDAEKVARAATEASKSMSGDASAALSVATARAKVLAETQRDALKETAAAPEAKKNAYLQEMYHANLPDDVAKTVGKPGGEEILFFASKSMQDGDMRGLLQTALADPRITIIFLGGEKEGGVKSLTDWLQVVGRGLPSVPPIQIDPPRFRDFKITQVPEAVVLRDGKEVARVGGVYSTQWIDTALQTRSGDLGTYGAMSTPIELDMQKQFEDAIDHYDWDGYAKSAVANFWRDQHLAPVPHATKPDVYEIDPSVTITQDVTLPNGQVLAHAGDRVNPLKVIPFKPTLLVIDASDPAQRQFAAAQVKKGDIQDLVVMSTAVPAEAADGWDAWAKWQDAIGAHLYLYSKPYASRFRLSATPSFVSGNGLTLKVRQVVVGDTQGAQ